MTDPRTDAAFKAYLTDLGELISGARLVPAWTPDGQALAFAEGPADQRRAWRVDLATGEKTPLLDIPKAREALTRALGYTPPGQGAPFEHFGFAGPSTIAAQIGTDQVSLDLETYSAAKSPAPSPVWDTLGISERARTTPRTFPRSTPLALPQPFHEVMSPDGAFLLSTQEHNVVVRSTYDGRPVVLTSDGTPETEWRFDLAHPLMVSMGMAAPATNFSPDGRRIAAYRVDLRGVSGQPQVHHLKREDEVVFVHHAKAGGVLERVTLHVLDLYGRPPVTIDLGDTIDTYPIFAGWLDGGERLVIFQMSRDCRRVDVLLADAASGAVTPVFTEQGDTFLRIHHDVYIGRKTGLTVTPDQRLLWLSARSGWQHLYLYDLGGVLVRQLTDGDWPVDAVQEVHDGFVYFTARPDQQRPYDVHICRVPLEGGTVEQLTQAHGVHSMLTAPTRSAFVDTWSNPRQPPVHELRSMDGSLLGEVHRADISRLTEEIGWQAPEQFAVKAADGTTDLWGVLFKPHDFDPAATYPVVEYIYGGPQIAVAPHGFVTAETMMGVQAQALAQRGYVVVMLDSRGTPGRSKAFHDAIYGRWANCLADDHAEAVLQLGQRFPYVDTTRVGIMGHSWGGYSAFRCLADRPDVYRAAVANAPGFDPFSSLLYECYLGLPHDNPDGYRFTSPYSLAARVEGAFMLACGTCDQATWSDAIKMAEALIRAGKDHEFVVLPEQGHVYDPAHDTHLQRKVAGFFQRHLHGASTPSQ